MLTTTPTSAGSDKREFPSLYTSSGDASSDRLAFFHVIERLKTQKRTGWVDHKERHIIDFNLILIPDTGPVDSEPGEVISDHMYRMALLAMCSADESLDTSKCVMMCLVHDLAEAQVGDIAPREGIPKAEKQRLEAEAMHNFVHVMLHNSPAARRIENLWKEYEAGQTDEARFVKDLDRFEMATQAMEYERAHGAQILQPFFDSSVPHIRHPEVQQWGRDLVTEREQLFGSSRTNSS